MKLDQAKIKEFYEKIPNVWPENDNWHNYSRYQIHNYLKKETIKDFDKVLNAGSGGNDYNLNCEMFHLDIAENKICHFKNYIVGSADNIPLHNIKFDFIICVGSVINYTDAISTISEFSRLTSKGGHLILEFESSWGYEHLKTTAFKKPAEIVTLKYNNESHKQWIYSYNYIKDILNSFNFKIENTYRFHILSSLVYNHKKDENQAAVFAKFDTILRYMPFVNRHSNNIIIKCVKL